MSQSDMSVFNEFFMPAIFETLDQMVVGFNEASNGAIQLATGSTVGDFILSSFYDADNTSGRRVDRYAANAAVAGTNLSQSELVAVKIAGAYGPKFFEPAQMTWLRKPTAEAIDLISRQMSEHIFKDQLNTAIRSLVAAIENQGATTTVDVSGGSVIDQSVLNNSHALFGDMSQSLVCQIMNGAQYHKLISQNLVNAVNLYTAGNVRVIDILGKKVVVTDSPALIDTVNGTYKVLSLAEGAAKITDPRDPVVNIDTTNGKVRIVSSVQMDYDFTLGLKGYSWDVTNGDKSPIDADLATGTNWDLAVASIKNSAGVISIGDQ